MFNVTDCNGKVITTHTSLVSAKDVANSRAIWCQQTYRVCDDAGNVIVTISPESAIVG